jgi:hypothetical protein
MGERLGSIYRFAYLSLACPLGGISINIPSPGGESQATLLHEGKVFTRKFKH